jgi:hypothetical protein
MMPIPVFLSIIFQKSPAKIVIPNGFESKNEAFGIGGCKMTSIARLGRMASIASMTIFMRLLR